MLDAPAALSYGADAMTITAIELPDEIAGLAGYVDNFAPDIADRTAQALAADYQPMDGPPEAGLYSDYLACPNDVDRISAEVGTPLVAAHADGTGRFSLRTQEMVEGIDVHIDVCFLGAVLFLNPPAQCRGGLSIFRHKPTGLVRFPDEQQQRELALAEPGIDYVRWFCLDEGKDRSRWEEIGRVEMRTNRLGVVSGGLFHSYTEAFGTSIADGRLAQLFFLNPGTTEDTPNGP